MPTFARGWIRRATVRCIQETALGMESEIYRATRAAWQAIWQDEGILQRELATLRYPRALQARSLYLPHLPQGDLLLEAGCGVGIRLVELSELGYRVLGVDYAENALATLHAYQPQHRLAVADVHRLPFADARFGGYLSLGVLEHFEFGPGPALMEARRVLRPGGVLVLALPYPSLTWRLARFKRLLAPPGKGHGPAYFETAFTVRDVEVSLRQAGFAVLARHPVGHSFALWGLGGAFRETGYYATSRLAEQWGRRFQRWLPWAMCFESLVIATKAPEA